jgi:hypothetical protein
MARDRLAQICEPLTARGGYQHDRRPPCFGCSAEQGERTFRFALGAARYATEIGLGDDRHIGQLHHPRLHELQAIAGTRLDAEHHGVGDENDVGLRLADPDALDQHAIVERAKQRGGGDRLVREAAEPVARRHRADEDMRVFRVADDTRAIAEQRAAADAR